MALCTQCNSELNGANFCSKCGAPAAGGKFPPSYSSMPFGADVRQRTLAEKEHMINHFSAKQTQYDEFEKVSEEVEARSSKGFFGWIIGAIISIVVGLISKSVFFYIAAAAFVAAFVLFKILNKKKLEAATTLQNKLLRELQDHFDAYGYCSVGFEYTKPSTLETLYEYVRTGRVNTLGDAINEYMKDIHNQRIEDMQKDILETEREIAKNTKKAAKYSRKAAIYSGASFFFK